MEKFLEEINERYKANQKQIDFHNKELRTLYDNEQALIKEFVGDWREKEKMECMGITVSG